MKIFKKLLFFIILAFLAIKAEGQTYAVVSQEVTDLQKNTTTVVDTKIFIHKIDSIYFFSENPDPTKSKFEMHDTHFFEKTAEFIIFKCCNGFFLIKFKYI